MVLGRDVFILSDMDTDLADTEARALCEAAREAELTHMTGRMRGVSLLFARVYDRRESCEGAALATSERIDYVGRAGGF